MENIGRDIVWAFGIVMVIIAFLATFFGFLLGKIV